MTSFVRVFSLNRNTEQKPHFRGELKMIPMHQVREVRCLPGQDKADWVITTSGDSYLCAGYDPFEGAYFPDLLEKSVVVLGGAEHV